jgi:hypothetical protein
MKKTKRQAEEEMEMKWNKRRRDRRELQKGEGRRGTG